MAKKIRKGRACFAQKWLDIFYADDRNKVKNCAEKEGPKIMTEVRQGLRIIDQCTDLQKAVQSIEARLVKYVLRKA